MLATAPVAPSPTIMGSSTEYIYRALADPLAPAPRQFKKHKTLPRPANEHDLHHDSTASSRHPSDAYRLVIDTSYTLDSSTSHASDSSSPQTLKQPSRRIASASSAGPDLPPTPPAHSRASSTGHPTFYPSPTAPEPVKLHPPPPISLRKPPVTPPDQRSPPTPDVTPPQPQTAVKAVRLPAEQSTAGTTPTDSRHDSFKTAQEEQHSSEDDHARAGLRSQSTSGKTSQTTILRVPDMPSTAPAQIKPLASAPPKAAPISVQQLTPRTMNEFGQFDGDWDSARQVEKDRQQERKQDGSGPQLVASKRKRPIPKTPIITTTPHTRPQVVESNIITPTAATRAARHMHVRDGSAVEASPVSSSVRSVSETSASVDARRSSATSARSSSSAVVEVMVMDGPSQLPQRRRTLRHVKKQNLLRQPRHVPDRASGGSFDGHRRLPQPQRKRKESPVARDRSRPPSTQTTSSNHPLGDGRARREIWNNGGIPVIVVPDRRSSHRSHSREPSLRSTSSRRSKRSASVGSPQQARGSLDASRSVSLQPRGREPATRNRDERTMDFAPTIPPRSSSLSATTSRNASRATSLTAESIRAHNAMQEKSVEVKKELRSPEAIPVLSPAPHISPRKAQDAQFGTDSGMDLYPGEDGLSVRKFSSRNTPFSVTSVATTGTAPEVSEAQAIHMYPHQNSSVLMVNHSARPSDSSNDQPLPPLPPVITRTDNGDEPPATPPEQLTKADDVDSPLRNPRAPPEPPVHPPMLNLIPATPSGATPSHESAKQLGNMFETSPPRRHSIVRRAFSRRRNSVDYPPTSSKPPSKLTRSFSLTRSLGLSSESKSRSVFDKDMDGELAPRRSSKIPVEGEKLHPFWRPQYDDDDDECEYGDSCPHHSKRDTIYRYPLVDNRPRPPKRSLSARVKNTFAIMPQKQEFPVEDAKWPERRTIRRTSSGNLRVMQRRASLDSLPMSPRLFRGHTEPPRPSTGTEQARRSFWRGPTLRRAETADGGTQRRSRRFSLSDKLEEIPNLPRKFNEKRREKRTQEIRQMISAPTQVRDSVGEVIRRGNVWGNQEAVKTNPSDF